MVPVAGGGFFCASLFQVPANAFCARRAGAKKSVATRRTSACLSIRNLLSRLVSRTRGRSSKSLIRHHSTEQAEIAMEAAPNRHFALGPCKSYNRKLTHRINLSQYPITVMTRFPVIALIRTRGPVVCLSNVRNSDLVEHRAIKGTFGQPSSLS